MHVMMETKEENFRPVLIDRGDCVQLRERFPGHPEFGVAAGGGEQPFEIHDCLKAGLRPDLFFGMKLCRREGR